MIDIQLAQLDTPIEATDILPEKDAASLIVHGGGSPRLRTSKRLAAEIEKLSPAEIRQLPGDLVGRFRQLTDRSLGLYKAGKISIQPNANTAPFLRDLITLLDVTADDLFPLEDAKSLRLYGRDTPHVVLSADLATRMRRHADIHNVDVNTVGYCLLAFVRSIIESAAAAQPSLPSIKKTLPARANANLVPVAAAAAPEGAVHIPFMLAQLAVSPEDIFPPADDLITFAALTSLNGWQYRVTETLLAQLYETARRLDRSHLVIGANLVADIITVVDTLMETTDDPLLRRLEPRGAELFPTPDDDVAMIAMDPYKTPIGQRLYTALAACAEDNGCAPEEIGHNMLEALRNLLAPHLASDNYYLVDTVPFTYELGSQLIGRTVTKLAMLRGNDPVPTGNTGTVIKLLPLEKTGFAVEIFWDHNNHWILNNVIDFMRFCQLDDNPLYAVYDLNTNPQ